MYSLQLNYIIQLFKNSGNNLSKQSCKVICLRITFIFADSDQTESGLYIPPRKPAYRLFRRKSKIIQSEVQTNQNIIKKILDVCRVMLEVKNNFHKSTTMRPKSIVNVLSMLKGNYIHM